MINQKKSETSLSQVIYNINESVTFSAIKVHLTGLENGVTAPTQADMGRIRYIKKGETKVDCQFTWLQFLNDFLGGSSIATLGTGVDSSAVDYWITIPRSLPDDNNVDHCEPGDLAQVIINYGPNLAARVKTNDTRIFLEECQGVSVYDLEIKQFDQAISANQALPQTISSDSIAMISIAGQDANGAPTLGAGGDVSAGRFTLDVAGKTYSGTVLDATFDTSATYRMEISAVETKAAVLYDSTLTGLKQGNGWADSAQLTVVNGGTADTLSTLVVGRRFVQGNYVASANATARYKGASIASKQATGKTTAVARIQDAGAA